MSYIRELQSIMADKEMKGWHKLLIVNAGNASDAKEYCQEKGIPVIGLSALLGQLLSGLTAEEKREGWWVRLKGWATAQEGPVLAFEDIGCMFDQKLGVGNVLAVFEQLSHHPRSNLGREALILFIGARKRKNLLIHSTRGSGDYWELDLESCPHFVLG